MTKISKKKSCSFCKSCYNKSMEAVYKVYWSAADADNIWRSQSKDFVKCEMAVALKFAESLRAMQRSHGKIRFVTMCSENPDSVGYPGVDVTGPEYDWKKRRV